MNSDTDQSVYPDDMESIVLSCGYSWPDDEEGRRKVMIGIARTVLYWRERYSEQRRISNELTRETPQDRTNRREKHMQDRISALSRKLKNVRKAAVAYRTQQNFQAFVNETKCMSSPPS